MKYEGILIRLRGDKGMSDRGKVWAEVHCNNGVKLYEIGKRLVVFKTESPYFFLMPCGDGRYRSANLDVRGLNDKA